MAFPSIANSDGRKAWAFAAICTGCAVMTVFAAVGVYIVRKDTQLSFYLALAAHAQILVGLTALGAQFVKRSIKVSATGIDISDAGEAAQVVADAAQTKADAVKADAPHEPAATATPTGHAGVAPGQTP